MATSPLLPDYKAQPLKIDTDLETIIDRIPSLIQAGRKISGTLAGQVKFGSKESGYSKSGIYSPSGGGVGGSGDYSQVANEPQGPGASG